MLTTCGMVRGALLPQLGRRPPVLQTSAIDDGDETGGSRPRKPHADRVDQLFGGDDRCHSGARALSGRSLIIDRHSTEPHARRAAAG